MGTILYLIATLMYIPLTLINVIVVLIKYSNDRGFLKVLDQYFFTEAISIDIFANESFRTLWNSTLRKSGGYKFGKKGETISSALGKNQRAKTLSWFGWILVYILWAFDSQYWKKGGHCINSINDDI